MTTNQLATYPAFTVAGRVILAGQPQPEDWAQLAAEGPALVINLRGDEQRAAVEQTNVEAAGLSYLHLPLPAYILEPEHLVQFQQIIDNQPGRIFFHCRTASRVALIWMLKRIAHDGWSRAEAEAELRAAGYDDDYMETLNYCADDYFERAEG